MKRWVDPNADPSESDGHNVKPPPTDMQLMRTDNAPTKLTPNPSGPPGGMIGPPGPQTGNKFSAGRHTLQLNSGKCCGLIL